VAGLGEASPGGKALVSAAPENFREAFLVLIDAGERLETIYVVTSEPHIP
jgi:hypothetical protein